FYIEAMGTFNDNSPTYTVSNGGETVVSGSLSGGDEATYTDLVCGDGDPEPSGDCSGPDSIIHDDGNIENGASGNPASVSQMEFVNKFTPVSYPATIESVCSSFITVAGGTPDLFYDIVVYDDDGAGGAPGTLIGEMTGLTAVNIPIFSAGDPAIWQSENTSSENWVINEGDVYIGVRFSP